MSSLFEDFGVPEPGRTPSPKLASKAKEDPTIRRLNPGPWDWQDMVLFSPESGTFRSVQVDVRHLSSKGTDMRDGGWVDPQFLVPADSADSVYATLKQMADAQIAYAAARQKMASKALYFARQAREEYQKALEVAKELEA